MAVGVTSMASASWATLSGPAIRNKSIRSLSELGCFNSHGASPFPLFPRKTNKHLDLFNNTDARRILAMVAGENQGNKKMGGEERDGAQATSLAGIGLDFGRFSPDVFYYLLGASGATMLPWPTLPKKHRAAAGSASRRIGPSLPSWPWRAFCFCPGGFQWFAFNRHKGYTVLIAIAAVGVALLLMLLWFLVAVLFRLRFQFSILSLLLLTLVVAVLCSWLVVERKQAREQREAVVAIRAFGGWGRL